MRKDQLEPEDSLGLLEPAPLVLITTESRGEANVSTCAWIMPAGPSPPTLILSLRRDSLTRRHIDDRGEFIVNIPGRRFAREIAFCGTVSGRELQKLEECGFRMEPGGKVRAPLLSDCIGHLECEALDAREAGGQILVTARVILATARGDLFVVGRGWDLENPDARFLLHLGGACYASPDRVIEIDPYPKPVRWPPTGGHTP